PPPATAEPAGPRPGLRVLEAGATTLSAGDLYRLEPDTTIGRAAANVIAIPDPIVSAHHAHVVQQGHEWWLEDLGSRNGTKLNQQPLTAAARLQPGDLIQIGPVVLQVVVE